MAIKAGDWVRFAVMPPWVERLPPESQRVYQFCLGRIYQVVDINEAGHLVLDVSSDIDPRFGGKFNDIRLESAYATPS